MNDTFACSVCGQTHAGLLTDEAYGLPDDVWAIPQEERASWAKFDSDLCQYGDRLFIRCLLPVPFTEADGYFGWGVWVEVDQTVFRRYLDLFEADGSSEPRYAGRLANDLPVYPGMLGATVLIQFGASKDRPSVHLPLEDSCRLATEQRQGIGSARYHEILDVLAARR
jgi:hypothetical protein